MAVLIRKNATRRSVSIPRTLVRKGAVHLVALYYLLRLSDLGREGIDRSGSFRFADHIYRGTPSGHTPLGRWLDARLLSLPAAQAFRRRCAHAQQVIRGALERLKPERAPLRVLSVPCGIPRDLLDVARELRANDARALERLEYHGLDIDPEALLIARGLVQEAGLNVSFHLGDALNREDYPHQPFDVIVSTGLGEFLDDHELTTLYTLAYEHLAPGGMFCTSATARDGRSDALLQMAEIVTRYREAREIEAVLRRLPWSSLELRTDCTHLQTFVTAVR